VGSEEAESVLIYFDESPTHLTFRGSAKGIDGILKPLQD